MIVARDSSHAPVLATRVEKAFRAFYTLVLSALAVAEPMIPEAFESFNPARQAVVLTSLILLMLMDRPRLLKTRELGLYVCFTAYMFVSLIWAPSAAVGMNTLLPAIDFALLMLLFGSLVAFHDLGPVIVGALGGFVLGAIAYSRATGFPFVYPEDFSYNAIAGMYLFGLFMTFIFAWFTRWRLLPLCLALMIMVLIAATTSIKTNIGIVLGAGAATLVYLGNLLGVLRRNFVSLCFLVTALVFAIVSNDALLERVQVGLDRVSRGVEILQRREDVSGDTSFEDRADWKNQGIKGWQRSPVFGNGVEAFRTDFGTTSHSTPIDLLYNTGAVGFLLFYSIFVSLALRLFQVRGANLGSMPALVFAGLVCYSFITLSGTMHYNAFMAIFLALSIGLLRRQQLRPTPEVSAPVAGVL